jgi:hypothetical protein
MPAPIKVARYRTGFRSASAIFLRADDLRLLDLELGEDLVRLVALGGEFGSVTPPGRITRSLDQAPAQQQRDVRFMEQMGPYGVLFVSRGLYLPASIGARQALTARPESTARGSHLGAEPRPD